MKVGLRSFKRHSILRQAEFENTLLKYVPRGFKMMYRLSDNHYEKLHNISCIVEVTNCHVSSAVLDEFAGWEKRLWLSSCTSAWSIAARNGWILSKSYVGGFLLKFGAKILVWWKKKGTKISGTVLEGHGTRVICLWMLIHDKFRTKVEKIKINGKCVFFK